MTAGELAAAAEGPRRAKPLTHSDIARPPWMRQTRAELFHVVTVATSSARAEAAWREAEQTGELAPRFDVDLLPEFTDDGRPILRELHRQVPHNIRKRYDRGELRAELARFDVSIHAVEKVSAAIAGYTKAHGCCHAETATLEERSGYDERVIRRVWAFLLETGYGWSASRIRADDRRIGSASRPCTSRRSTVRVLGVLPAVLLETLGPEELLDLIAVGERAPELTGPANDREPAAPRAPAAPTPTHSAPRPAAATTGDPNFVTFAAVFAREHAARYGAGVDPGRVRADNQATIAGYVLDLAAEACAWAAQPERGGRELERATVREDLCTRLVRAWLASPGTSGYLRDKRHPIGLIVDDLARFGAPALEGWKMAQPAPPKPPPPPAAEKPELLDDAPTLDLLAAIRADVGAPPPPADHCNAPKACEEPVDELGPVRVKLAEIQARGGGEAPRPRLLSLGPLPAPKGPRRPP